MNAVECKKVKKQFKEKTVFEELNLKIEAGKIYGLLGRNGSGKTTLMNLITTKYLPTEGEIEVFGEPVYENENVLRKICFMSDYMPAFLNSSVKNLLKDAAAFYDNWDQAYAEKLLQLFQIEKKESYNVLSKGKKTCIGIIIGMASNCELTIFDEIYSGLDAVARQQFYDLILEDYMEKQRTFILSTHLISEMGNLFSDLILIDQGKVLIQGEVEELRTRIYAFSAKPELLEKMNPHTVLKKESFGGTEKRILNGTFTSEELSEYQLQGIKVESLSLQDIFITLTTGEVKE
ncbi:ABC transporter, ATP-binding protein [Lachnospiraceae bacterium KM106-2]|nr:ABC transporter, ATP-binding protein [Lachnospiraceae bacterium KM106-2]